MAVGTIYHVDISRNTSHNPSFQGVSIGAFTHLGGAVSTTLVKKHDITNSDVDSYTVTFNFVDGDVDFSGSTTINALVAAAAAAINEVYDDEINTD